MPSSIPLQLKTFPRSTQTEPETVSQVERLIPSALSYFLPSRTRPGDLKGKLQPITTWTALIREHILDFPKLFGSSRNKMTQLKNIYHRLSKPVYLDVKLKVSPHVVSYFKGVHSKAAHTLNCARKLIFKL